MNAMQSISGMVDTEAKILSLCALSGKDRETVLCGVTRLAQESPVSIDDIINDCVNRIRNGRELPF